MKRIRFIFKLAILMMALIFPSSSIAADSGGAKIFIPEIVWEFGRIPEGSVVSHVYWIKNIGTDTLKITEVKTTCGCTKAPLNKKVIASNDSTEVELIFSAGRYEGEVVKSASITSNDTALGKVKIYFSGKLVLNFNRTFPITISPSRIDFSSQEEGTDTKRKLRIKNVSPVEITVAVLDYPRDLIKFNYSQIVIKSGNIQELDIDLKGEKEGTKFKKSITLEVDGDKEPRFTVPLLKSGMVDAVGGSSKK